MRRRDALRANVAAAAAGSFAVLALVGCNRSRERSDHPLQSAFMAPTTTTLDSKPPATDKALLGTTVRGESPAPGVTAGCGPGMVSIDGRFCIDRYEGSLVETAASGEDQPFSPYSTVGQRRVRAVSAPHVVPQGYISATEAGRACAASGKRLCRISEWEQACRGPQNQQYGYGARREPGRCNDTGRSPVVKMFGFRFDGSTMNNPQLNQMPGTLSKTGEHEGCSNGYGVYDMVGNLHEWVADSNGAFYGGYYLDVASVGHGDGCGYRTTAHGVRYHDYSTGFRCCSDPTDGERSTAKPEARPVKPVPRPKAPTKRGGTKKGR